MNGLRPNQSYPSGNRVPPQDDSQYYQETTPISPSPSNSFPEEQNWQSGPGPVRGPSGPGHVKPSGPGSYRGPSNQPGQGGPNGPQSGPNTAGGSRVNRLSGSMGPDHGMVPPANRTVSSNSSQGDENWNSPQSSFPGTGTGKDTGQSPYALNSPANQQSRPDSRGQYGSQPGSTGFKPDDLSPRPTPSPNMPGQPLSGPDRPMVQNQSRNNSADIMGNSPYSTGNNFPSGQPSPASQYESSQFQNRNQKPGQMNQPNRGQIPGQPGQNQPRMNQNESQKPGLSRAFPGSQPVNRQRNITPTSKPPGQMQNQSPVTNRNQPMMGNQSSRRQPTAQEAWDQAMGPAGNQPEPGSQNRFSSTTPSGNLPPGQMMNQQHQNRNLNGPRSNHGMNQPQNQRMDQNQPSHQKRPSFGGGYEQSGNQSGLPGKPGQISPLPVNRQVRGMDQIENRPITDQGQMGPGPGSMEPNLQSRPGIDPSSVIKTSSSQSYEQNSEFLGGSQKPVGSVIQSGRPNNNRPPMSSVNTPSKVAPSMSQPRTSAKMGQKHSGSISGNMVQEQNDPLTSGLEDFLDTGIMDRGMDIFGSFPPVSSSVSKPVHSGSNTAPITSHSHMNHPSGGQPITSQSSNLGQPGHHPPGQNQPLSHQNNPQSSNLNHAVNHQPPNANRLPTTLPKSEQSQTPLPVHQPTSGPPPGHVSGPGHVPASVAQCNMPQQPIQQQKTQLPNWFNDSLFK